MFWRRRDGVGELGGGEMELAKLEEERWNWSTQWEGKKWSW